MSVSNCIELGWWFTTVLEEPDLQQELRELLANHASMETVLQALVARAPEPIAANLRTEFAELPATTLPFIIQAWSVANAAGKRFEVASERPAALREFARKRRVSVSIEAEEDQMRVIIRHIASRHAEWYRPAAAVSA